MHRRLAPTADESVAGDLRQPASLVRAVAGVDAVAHLAALTHARRGRDYAPVNVAGTEGLLSACRDSEVRRFLHVSTRAISAEGGSYSRSKRRAEELVRGMAPDAVIVRLSEIYGTGGAEGIEGILGRVRRGRAVAIVGDGSDELCPVHVDDAVAALAAALEAEDAAGRTYTLAGDCLTVRRFVESSAAALGSSSRAVGVPLPVVRSLCAAATVLPLPLVPDQLDRLRSPKGTDSSSARTELGFSPRPLAVGLAGASQATERS